MSAVWQEVLGRLSLRSLELWRGPWQRQCNVELAQSIQRPFPASEGGHAGARPAVQFSRVRGRGRLQGTVWPSFLDFPSPSLHRIPSMSKQLLWPLSPALAGPLGTLQPPTLATLSCVASVGETRLGEMQRPWS